MRKQIDPMLKTKLYLLAIGILIYTLFYASWQLENSNIKFMSMVGKQQRQTVAEPLKIFRICIGRRHKVQGAL